jgi:hypothetical protein
LILSPCYSHVFSSILQSVILTLLFFILFFTLMLEIFFHIFNHQVHIDNPAEHTRSFISLLQLLSLSLLFWILLVILLAWLILVVELIILLIWADILNYILGLFEWFRWFYLIFLFKLLFFLCIVSRFINSLDIIFFASYLIVGTKIIISLVSFQNILIFLLLTWMWWHKW